MANRTNVLGIIPARGGSKGIPRKNIRHLAGRPLISYSIEAAQNSEKLTDWYVSTEDVEIAGISEKWGAKVLERPPHLAEDETPMLPVVQNAMIRLAERGNRYDAVMILQPTCPLRAGGDIDAALTLMENTSSESVVGVYRVEDHHPGRMYRLENGFLAPYAAELATLNRQDLPPVYHRNGSIYGVRVDVVLSGSLYGDRICAYEMPRSRSLNIDEEFDWKFAEWLMGSQ